MTKKKFNPSWIILNIVLITFTFTCIFPVVWMLYSSFKKQKDFNSNSIGLPKIWTLENFQQIFSKTEIPRQIINSFIVGFISVSIIVLIGFVLGYFLARFKFKMRRVLYSFFLMGMLIPIHALLVPMNILMKNLVLIDTLWGLILTYASFGLPTAIFLSESYIRAIPKEMEEAAAVDGAGFTRTLFEIILNMTMPVLATVAIISFFACWNEFSFALVLINSPVNFTVPLGLTVFKGSYASNYPMIMAGTLVSLVPVMLLYFAFSRKIMEGMVAGAVKG